VAFVARQGMPTAARSIHRDHGEAFIAAELERTAPSSAAARYRSLQQLFSWLDEQGEIEGSPMAKTRPPKIPEKPAPCFPMTTCGACWPTAVSLYLLRRRLRLLCGVAEHGQRVSRLVGILRCAAGRRI
jgi:site-specific recombinase XerC